MNRGSLFQPSLTEGDYHPQVVSYYFKQWNDFQMPFHSHDATEIMYVIAGVCRIEIERNQTAAESMTLKKGEFILVDANVPHRLIVEKDAPCRMLNVEFRFIDRKGMFPSIKDLAGEDGTLVSLLSAPCPYLVLRDPDEVYHVLKRLVLELDSGEKGNGTMMHLLFSQLLIRIARLRKETENTGLQQTDYYVKQSIEFLHHNYDRDIRVKDVASAVNLHPGYLHRIFKLHTGRTLTEYLTGIRMEKAKMLLLQTDIPVTDISDYVGVASRQYFHSLFKKYTKQTPSEFRKSAEAFKRDYR